MEVVRNHTVFCRTIKQIFEAQQRLKEKNWEYKLQVCDKYCSPCEKGQI